MARIDESRPFIPVNIAVLTVSDTRTSANDTSGDTLAERIVKAGHRVVARLIEKDDAGAIEQRLRLEAEGVRFRGRKVDMKACEYKFGASTRFKKKM